MKGARRWLIRAGAVLVLGIVFLVILDVFLRSHAPPLPPLPVPNGYDDLARAANLAASLSGYEEIPLKDLQGAMEQNAKALQIARSGLSRECRNPARCAEQKNPPSDCKQLFRLVFLFGAEGWLAENEKRLVDAVKSYSDLYQFGSILLLGGIGIEPCVGISAQQRAVLGLRNVLNSMSVSDSKLLIDHLQHWSLDESMADEACRFEGDLESPDTSTLHALWTRLRNALWGQAEIMSYKESLKITRTYSALLIAQLAIHTYRIEHGANPQAIDDLIPMLLDRIPTDPYSGKPLLYRKTPQSYQLYSVGPNGKDDQGMEDDMTHLSHR
jgi:hypothetical protein